MPSRATASSIQTSRKTGEAVADIVNEYQSDAIQMMANAGFKIRDNVKVTVDPQLPFMGYTMPQGQSFTIVVSGGAVASEMLEGLLVHEMSHIYRIQTNHPSHNAEILEQAVQRLGKKRIHSDYQQKIVHDLLNDIQDLYADDIAFQVFRTARAPVLDRVTDFLQGMVTDKSVKSGDRMKDRWVNTSIMVHNARAVAQMARHRVEDTGDKADGANQRFLAQVSPDIAEKFDFFRNLLANLREGVTEDEYRALLAEYLNKFLEVAEKD